MLSSKQDRTDSKYHLPPTKLMHDLSAMMLGL